MLRDSLEQAQNVVQTDTAVFFRQYIHKVSSIDRWSEDVATRLEEYCLRKGKAVRALLVALGAAIASGESLEKMLQDADVRRLMLVIEFTHRRLLLADDIADQDEMRNEKPAFHVQFRQDLSQRPQYAKVSAEQLTHISRSYSEVAGIWLQALTWKLVEESGLEDSLRTRLAQILLQCVYEKTSAGWYILLDQNFETLEEQESEERLLKGLELVTGEYTFVAPLLLGATLKGASAQTLAQLEKYGQVAGVLFQITDDVLGLFGDPAVTGKPSGNDVREGKKTLLVQYAYRLGTTEEKAFLERAVGNPSITVDEIQRVREIVEQTGALQKTKDVIADHVTRSLQALEALPNSPERDGLAELVYFLAQRQK